MYIYIYTKYIYITKFSFTERKIWKSLEDLESSFLSSCNSFALISLL